MALAVALLFVVSITAVTSVRAAPTAIIAPQATVAVNLKTPYSAAQWTDTTPITDPTSGITFGAKQNGTGWYFFMTWQSGGSDCADSSCYGGIELDTLSNAGVMGAATTPSLMILASPSFVSMVGHAVDEFISTNTVTPSSVESLGSYTTQSVCGALNLSGTTYSVQCYRPFTLKGADPQDPTATMTVGSTVEIGFAVGEFDSPGLHNATPMTGYTLTFTGASSSSSSASQTTSSSSGSSTPTTSTTQSTTSTPVSSAETINAYQSQYPVQVTAAYSASQWKDTVTVTEPTSQITAAFKENGTGLIFMLTWQTSSTVCSNTYCYGGIELGNLNNTGVMGASSTPTLMILISPSFTPNVNEFISTGTFTPTSVTKDGYTSQTTCGLTVSAPTYTAICYRPFATSNGWPGAPKLGIGSTVELGFAVGEFNSPGVHDASNMQSYVLYINGSKISSGSSTSESVTAVSSTGSGFPGLNATTLFVVAAGAALIGVVLGISTSVRARNAASAAKAGHA